MSKSKFFTSSGSEEITDPPILIADSGATKTDWCLTKKGDTSQVYK